MVLADTKTLSNNSQRSWKVGSPLAKSKIGCGISSQEINRGKSSRQEGGGGGVFRMNSLKSRERGVLLSTVIEKTNYSMEAQVKKEASFCLGERKKLYNLVQDPIRIRCSAAAYSRKNIFLVTEVTIWVKTRLGLDEALASHGLVGPDRCAARRARHGTARTGVTAGTAVTTDTAVIAGTSITAVTSWSSK